MVNIMRKSLLVRLITFLLIIGIVPLLFLGIVSIISMNNVLKNEAVEFQKENVKQGTQYINLVMDDVESLIANLSGIDEVNMALSGSVSETSYDKLTTQATIGYILSGYTNLKGLVSIDLFSSSGAHYHVGETLNANNIDSTVFDKLLSETDDAEGFVYWSGIENNINLNSEYPSVITATKKLNAKNDDGSTSSETGLLIVSYDTAVFSDVFGESADPDGYTIVLDGKNRIVYHPVSNYIGYTISDDVSAQINAQENGFFTQKIDGENMLVVFDGTQKGGWTVAKFIPLSNLWSNANTMTVSFIGLIVFSITVTVLFGLSMNRQVVKPIRQVTNTFRLLQSGDFTNVSKLKIVHHDEIGELGKLFNSFIDAREDITTQKKLEKQLNDQNHELQEALATLKTAQTQMVQQEKMAGIGQLAAGVAHEINNPLGFVKSNFAVLHKYTDRVERLLEVIDTYRQMEAFMSLGDHKPIEQTWEENSIDFTRSDLKEIISDTQEGLHRIAEIVNALKMFSRSSLIEERSPYDLNEGIKTTLLIANNEIKYNSTVETNLSPLPLLSANGGQVNQVLLNLIVNAAQAIKQNDQNEKGLITIETHDEGDYVCCFIRDNGCGMKEADMNRIFEPFFTTKPVGQGTGLGLSLAYDIIVNKHGGMLEVTSEEGVGTCFKITLPVNQKDKDEQN